MATQTFQVAGMTCGHCVNAVTQELSALDGVQTVSIELGQDAPSQVTVEADRELGTEEITEALDEAGDYTLA